MIVHHERRGGGDLGDLGPIKVAGRWRGDRIVLLGANGFTPSRGKTVTQDDVRGNFLDVTRNAEASSPVATGLTAKTSRSAPRAAFQTVPKRRS